MPRVLVTGASGFVGSHAAARLIESGHDVIALARRPRRVDAALAPHGVGPAAVVEGDMADPDAVARALDGCDAVIHAAAQIGVSGGTEVGPQTNVEGVRNVIGGAIEHGCDPIVYTSTFTVHLPTDDEVIGPDTAFAEPLSVYGRSKLECERLVAGWQNDGAPVTTVVLGGVYGPDSPHLDGSAGALIASLTTMSLAVDGGLPIVDVRDTADLLAALVAHPGGPARLMAGGHFVTWHDLADVLDAVTGRDTPRFEITVDGLLDMARGLDVRRAAGETVDIPLTEDAAVIMTAGRPTDDQTTWSRLGLAPRPTADTIRDAVAWLVAEGHVDADLAPGA